MKILIIPSVELLKEENVLQIYWLASGFKGSMAPKETLPSILESKVYFFTDLSVVACRSQNTRF